MMTDTIGSLILEYRFDRDGVSTRYAFYMKVGDDPNWKHALRLMPGAVCIGRLAEVFEVDTGAVDHDRGGFYYVCELHVRGSVFKTQIWAESGAEALERVRAIGGLRLAAGLGFFLSKHLVEPQAGRWERLKLWLRYHWLRRPQIRRRSPLDVFDLR